MLYCAADKLFLSADQVLSKISPNVSVWAVEPDQNSLGEYLASLASLTTTLPYDVMVLPGHGVPFYGLKTRIKQLADHHEDRCRLIAEACREVPQTSRELVPVVFHKYVLDVHQMGFAAGELIAHVNYMLIEGRLTSEVDRRRVAVPDHLTAHPPMRLRPIKSPEGDFVPSALIPINISAAWVASREQRLKCGISHGHQSWKSSKKARSRSGRFHFRSTSASGLAMDYSQFFADRPQPPA